MSQISSINGFSIPGLVQKASEKINDVLDKVVKSTYLNPEDSYYDDEEFYDGFNIEDQGDETFYDDRLVEVLVNDPPKKAYVAYNENIDKTIIKLYDDDGERYYKDKVDGNLQKEYNRLIFEYTTDKDIEKENIVNISVIKGNKKPKRNITKSVKTLKPDIKEQVGRTLVSMQNDTRRERVYVKPIFPKDSKGASFKTDYSLFEFRLAQINSDFDIEPVLKNLNISLGENLFNDDTIEEVMVGYGGTNISLKTKDGLRAFLNFQNGRREITDTNPEDGLEVVLQDNNGPLIKG